jgi:hypothetical protein
MMNWKGYGKSYHGIIEVLSWHVPQETAGNQEKSQSG